MDIIKMILQSLIHTLTNDVNKMIKRKKESLQVIKFSTGKAIFIAICSISFLMANFTSMIAVLLKDVLGYGLIFPISSSVFLYIACIVSMKCIYSCNEEAKFFKRKIEHDTEVE